MCDQDHSEKELLELEAQGKITRRQFGALLGAGVVMMLPQVQNAVAVAESDVTIKTPDGTCDAYFVHPTTGTAPGVLVWPDIFGLRPAFRRDQRYDRFCSHPGTNFGGRTRQRHSRSNSEGQSPDFRASGNCSRRP